MALKKGVGSKWTIGLGGKGFIVSTLDQQSPFEYRAYTIEPIPLRLPRIDNSSEPGEQSIGSLWPRAQHSWHEGSGQRLFDGEESSRYKSRYLVNLDPFSDPGYLHLLQQPAAYIYTGGASNPTIEAIIVVDDNLITFDSDGEATRYTDITTEATNTATASLGSESSTQKSVTANGKLVYFFHDTADGVHSLDASLTFAAASSTKVNNLNGDVMAFVKGRLMVGKDASIHQITDLSSLTDGATAFFIHMADDWKWTDFTEGGPGIFACGYASGLSQIYHIGFDDSTAASGLILNAPRVVWEAPVGEIIHSIEGYLGSAFLIGTNRGIRNALIGSDGNIQVSGLIARSDITNGYENVITIDGEYGYGVFEARASDVEGVEDYVDPDKQYVVRIDLSNLGWCLMGIVADYVEGLAIWGVDGLMVNSLEDLANDYSYVRAHHLVTPITTSFRNGYLVTGDIRFGTSEDKTLRKLDLRQRNENSGLLFDSQYDVLLSDREQGRVSITDGKTDGRGAYAWVYIDPTAPSRHSVLATHGDPYGASTASPEEENIDIYWEFALVATGDADAGKLRFRWKDAAGTIQEAVSSVTLSSVVGSSKLQLMVGFRFNGDVTGNWEVRFLYDDTDPYTGTTALGTTITGGATSELYDGDDLPLFIGTAESGDLIIRVQIYEDYSSDTFTTIDWNANSPYIDKYTNSYEFIHRVYNSVDDVWEKESTVDPSIEISNGLTITSRIRSSGGDWRLLDSHKIEPHTLDLENQFIGDRFQMVLQFSYNSASSIGEDLNDMALSEWRLRSEPVPRPRYSRHYVPVMLYDRMSLLDGHPIHRQGYAKDELAILRGWYNDGDLLDFQPPDLGDSIKVRIDELHFKAYASPKGGKGFGGIALLVLREQE